MIRTDRVRWFITGSWSEGPGEFWCHYRITGPAGTVRGCYQGNMRQAEHHVARLARQVQHRLDRPPRVSKHIIQD